MAISDLSTAISRKRCKIAGKLLLITNRKSYRSFRLVPKSVTLNDLERRNGVISANSRSFRAHCVKVHVRYLNSWWDLVVLILGSSTLLVNMPDANYTCPAMPLKDCLVFVQWSLRIIKDVLESCANLLFTSSGSLDVAVCTESREIVALLAGYWAVATSLHSSVLEHWTYICDIQKKRI